MAKKQSVIFDPIIVNTKKFGAKNEKQRLAWGVQPSTTEKANEQKAQMNNNKQNNTIAIEQQTKTNKTKLTSYLAPTTFVDPSQTE